MIVSALAWAAAAVAQPPTAELLKQASHALEVGRADQARLMIARAVEAGVPQSDLGSLIADLAFADHDYARAASLYDALALQSPADGRVYERAGLARLQLGEIDKAAAMLERGAGIQASWRGWNALGVIADLRRDWAAADSAYEHAAALAPQSAEIVNNMGWSLLLRGRWHEAEDMLTRAVAFDSKLERAARNLELARAASDETLPRRQPNESDADWAARLNDAGVIAQAQGDNRKAVAAFARALEARSQWFARAANNLALAESAN